MWVSTFKQSHKPWTFGGCPSLPTAPLFPHHTTSLIQLLGYKSFFFYFKDTLAQLVYKYKEANKALRHDFQELKKLYIESQEDVQLMRERMRRQSSSSSNHGDDTSDSVTDEKEECILQLEEYKEQVWWLLM